jgi:hypothetical protein
MPPSSGPNTTSFLLGLFDRRLVGLLRLLDRNLSVGAAMGNEQWARDFVHDAHSRTLFAPHAPISSLLHNVVKHAKLGGGEGGIRTPGAVRLT